MKIRSALPSDAPALALILSDWIDDTAWMPRIHTRADDLGFVTRLIADRDVMVAEDGAPLGFLARSADDVMALYLAPAAQGRGVGKALLDHAKATCAQLQLWTFQANTRARRFYAREGFVEDARTVGDNDEGLPDIHMTWSAQR